MKRTEILLLGTLHGLHKDNSYYNYQHIFKIIEQFEPDIIGVEIREEDLNQSREYLTEYYPYEMIETKYRFQERCDIVGFDYFEKSVIGKLIPKDYFKNLRKVTLEKEFETDKQYENERKLLDTIDLIRLDLVMKHTAQEVNDGKYDVASKIYYQQLEILLNDTPYQEISDFRKVRDQHIDDNIVSIIRNNQGKKLFFLMGIDHRVFALEKMKDAFQDEVSIKPVLGNEFLE